ncbi:FecR domain-containing protein [Pandoraea bronchicola]|uniref:FecR family protein n=1 Tax=Pandoraea bronchicola TaxID=2508287 RepID=A0A5E5BNV8_9BURK|nr:FecR family protein [Pandoraea bronchicola]VVE86812.1 FecR family protein [Pandoraea bronchicola]
MSTDTHDLHRAGGPSSASATLPESVTLAATEWFVRLQAHDAPGADADARATTHAAWQRWHDADTRHALAWQRLVDFGAHLRTLPPLVAHNTLVRARGNPGRRRALSLIVFAGVAGAVWSAGDSNAVRAWRADVNTGVGERRTVQLADGTTLSLNTDSAVDISLSQDTRRLRLVRGEIAITTGADADHGHRPFFVDTAQGSLQALGTRFAVRQHDDSATVTVLEGAVRIVPAKATNAATVLTAGQGATFDATTLRSRFEDTGAANAAAAWTQGMLVVHAMPLGDFLTELGRYRRGHLGYAPEVAGLRVSGIYPVDDTDRVLDMLSRALPVDVRRYTRWFVRVQPGSATSDVPGRERTYQAVGGDRPHT